MEITQEEVISQFEALMQRPIEEVMQEATELKALFYKLHNEAQEAEREQLRADGVNLKEVETAASPLELRFKDLYAKYRDARSKLVQRRQDEQQKNLAAKEQVIAELKNLIDNEENIGKSFDHFRDLQDRWRSIGSVPADRLADLRAAYMSEVDRFYYNIKINKELKEYDLTKNLDLRTAIVAKLEELRSEEKIKDIELILNAAKDEWEETGPVHKEAYPELRERYYNVLRELHKKIQDHYSALKDELNTNLEAKRALVNEVRGLVEICGDSLPKFNASTQRIEEIKELWKHIGQVEKKASIKVWNEFKEAQNAFFEAKRAVMGQAREGFKENKVAKETLVAKALSLKDSTDWKETTEELKKLQNRWKTIGPAGPRDDQKLWAKFREACDGFFTAKKHFFDTMDDRQADNLKAKEAMLTELASIKLEGDKEAKRTAIKALMDRWNSLGHVPKADIDRIEAAFKKALDGLYAQLGMDRTQSQNIRMKDRLERLATDKDGSKQVEREMRQVQDKLKEKEAELFRYENNLAFFSKAKSNNPLLLAAQQNIEQLKVEVEELRRKIMVFKQFA
jgi:hypothetical protein